MHKDVSPDHFMRYFLVTDPVGRILAIKKRTFQDGLEESCTLSSLTEEERNFWGVTQDYIPKINDCPFVLIFMEDVQEVLTMGLLWLR